VNSRLFELLTRIHISHLIKSDCLYKEKIDEMAYVSGESEKLFEIKSV
jgi:hypothetical protein